MGRMAASEPPDSITSCTNGRDSVIDVVVSDHKRVGNEMRERKRPREGVDSAQEGGSFLKRVVLLVRSEPHCVSTFESPLCNTSPTHCFPSDDVVGRAEDAVVAGGAGCRDGVVGTHPSLTSQVAPEH